MFLLYGQTTKCPVPAHMFEQREFMRGTGNLNFVACPYLEEHESSYSVSCTRTVFPKLSKQIKKHKMYRREHMKERMNFPVKSQMQKDTKNDVKK